MEACIFKVSYCIGVDAQRRTFHRCRASNPVGQIFTIEVCSALGQVMDIQSAVVGYSDPFNLARTPPLCIWRNCTKSIYDTVFQLCNGRRRCDISQDLLIRPGNSALCPLSRDANFIDVKYFCGLGRLHA